MRLKNKNLNLATFEFFSKDAVSLAQELLFCAIYVKHLKRFFRIVETEAYTQEDPASHSFRGISSRNKSMFLEGGHLYVYKIYGIHHCLNIVSGVSGVGEAVLVRSLVDLDSGQLLIGPGRVCKLLNISTCWDGVNILQDGRIKVFHLEKRAAQNDLVRVTTRIGITKGKELLRRFFLSAFERYLPKPR